MWRCALVTRPRRSRTAGSDSTASAEFSTSTRGDARTREAQRLLVHGEGDVRPEDEAAVRDQRIELTVAAGRATPLDELAAFYLDDLEARTSERHHTQVRSQLHRILAALPARTVEELRPRHVIAYRNAQLKEGRSHRCANFHLQCLRGALNWARAIGEIPVNPIAGVKPLPTGERHATQHRRALTEGEVERLLAAVEEEDLRLADRDGHRVPQAPLFRAFLETGARYGELIALVWADLDRDARTLTLRARNTKAGRLRTIPLTQRLARDLLDLQAHHERVSGIRPVPSSPIFLWPVGRRWPRYTNNVRRILDRLLRAAGIPQVNDRGEKVDVHALRHCALTRFARAGVPLAQTQAIAGHSDPKITARTYTHLAIDDLRSAVDRLGGVQGPREPARLRAAEDLDRDAV